MQYICEKVLNIYIRRQTRYEHIRSKYRCIVCVCASHTQYTLYVQMRCGNGVNHELCVVAHKPYAHGVCRVSCVCVCTAETLICASAHDERKDFNFNIFSSSIRQLFAVYTYDGYNHLTLVGCIARCSRISENNVNHITQM